MNSSFPFHYKNRRGEEILRDPLGQNWDFYNPPGQKRVFSFTRLEHKTGFFTPFGHVFFLWPPDSFVQFTPLRQFFPPILPPLGQYFFVNFTPFGHLFHPFYPARKLILTFFRKFYPPRTPFLETPLDKNLHFLPPGQQQELSVPPSDRVVWPPRTKRPFPPLPVFLME